MSTSLRKGLPSRTPVTMAMSSPPGVAPPALASMSLRRVLTVSSGKRPGRATWPSTETWLPRICTERDVDLGLLDEAAGLQGIGNFLFGRGHRQAAQLDRADEWVGDAAALGDAGFDREVGVLEHLHADGVARAQRVVGLALGVGARDRRSANTAATRKRARRNVVMGGTCWAGVAISNQPRLFRWWIWRQECWVWPLLRCWQTHPYR